MEHVRGVGYHYTQTRSCEQLKISGRSTAVATATPPGAVQKRTCIGGSTFLDDPQLCDDLCYHLRSYLLAQPSDIPRLLTTIPQSTTNFLSFGTSIMLCCLSRTVILCRCRDTSAVSTLRSRPGCNEPLYP